ncbi:hypothetical protein G9A89_006529 [Geosiphon pyriformis]|nr:hypothetical protein G9A89_006529 [Geosiphon pyriformis]
MGLFVVGLTEGAISFKAKGDLRNFQRQRVMTNYPNLTDLLSSAKKYTGDKSIGYTQAQLYEVVSNINEYQLFIPYCTKSTVLTHECLDYKKEFMTAELGVGFNGFEETYISEVTCDRPNFVKVKGKPETPRIAIASSDKIFQHLTSIWRFHPHYAFPKTHCTLSFDLEFEFASPIYAQVSNIFFDKVSLLMVNAFEGRCHQIYGPAAELPTSS